MHELSDQKDVFCKIGSHLGDVDNDPNTPKSEDGSFLSGESGVVFFNQSHYDHPRTIKNMKKRSLQPNQQKRKEVE